MRGVEHRRPGQERLRQPMRCDDSDCNQRSNSRRFLGCCAWRQCLIVAQAMPECHENAQYLCQTEHDDGDNERPHGRTSLGETPAFFPPFVHAARSFVDTMRKPAITSMAHATPAVRCWRFQSNGGISPRRSGRRNPHEAPTAILQNTIEAPVEQTVSVLLGRYKLRLPPSVEGNAAAASVISRS